ncbi:hypothetical protein HYS03_01845 [Candidatus Woesebacteria bacterium]|nr:hypothetical protein [Candidatus Woesebacteria bacterium]QQG47887.1 MAG: hypothetical protein HY044_02260 [Candidatus Woesebacteria bacterium]
MVKPITAIYKGFTFELERSEESIPEGTRIYLGEQREQFFEDKFQLLMNFFWIDSQDHYHIGFAIPEELKYINI